MSTARPTDPAAALRRGVRRIKSGGRTWLVIADLHLDPLGDERVSAFTAWLGGLEDSVTLAILGDLFDVWVGPSQARLPGSGAVVDALRELTARGVPVHVVPGNRDFLLGAAFEQATGVEVHPAGFVLVGEEDRGSLLVHGGHLGLNIRW